MDIDLTAITLQQAFALLAVVTFIDVLGAYLLAVIHGNFSLGVVALWLQSHTIRRVFPIFALAVIGNGIPAFGVPKIEAAWVMAVVGLTAYVVETIASIAASFKDTTPPSDTTPIT
jgi:hypothetical protein